jgi:hypothetical protein
MADGERIRRRREDDNAKMVISGYNGFVVVRSQPRLHKVPYEVPPWRDSLVAAEMHKVLYYRRAVSKCGRDLRSIVFGPFLEASLLGLA